MVGLELYGEAEPIVVAMRDRRILINGTDKTVLRFVPPMIVTAEEINTTVDTLREVLASHSSF
jgi:acetylornithine/succinyldiaminopimelate/putrescine aminotransferase